MMLLGFVVFSACKPDHPSGAPGIAQTSTASHIAPAECGNGQCESDLKEDCAGCPEDCGRCTGCDESLGFGCFGCKCEKCVCAKIKSCCGRSGKWGPRCVKACKEQCGGCGVGAGKPAPGTGRPR